ncbi:hypothetical protein QQF64_033968 [Cirrhinus molitorella]|uniref:Uncharacterized protein n=1 Tax=Cirrhinus molitorella TaxID=172907 RepID=A0ABR3MVF3_9TELE
MGCDGAMVFKPMSTSSAAATGLGMAGTAGPVVLVQLEELVLVLDRARWLEFVHQQHHPTSRVMILSLLLLIP